MTVGTSILLELEVRSNVPYKGDDEGTFASVRSLDGALANDFWSVPKAFD